MAQSLFRKLITYITLAAFLASGITPAYAQGIATVLDLPKPGAMVEVSPVFVPAILKGINVDIKQPFKFDFILDTGNSGLDEATIKAEADKLIRYFLASLTIPEKDLWVNLSPYEKDRIMEDTLSLTEMGRDMLSQDYILKQITASLIYPESGTGKAFWKQVYERSYDLYGTTDVPLDTFNKVWVLPDEAEVYENDTKAFVTKATMKVMLETDYLMMANVGVGAASGRLLEAQGGRPEVAPTQSMSELTKNILRTVVVPILEKEVNEGRNFSQLRQIYHSLILAKWYKETLKDSILNRKYSDQGKVRGVDLQDKDVKQKIYAQYLQAFKKGVFNYIKEEQDINSAEIVPRKYFSGGVDYAQKINLTKTFILPRTIAGVGRIFKVDGLYDASQSTILGQVIQSFFDRKPAVRTALVDLDRQKENYNTIKSTRQLYNRAWVRSFPMFQVHTTSSSLVRKIIFGSNGYISPQAPVPGTNLGRAIYLSSYPQMGHAKAKVEAFGGQPVVLEFSFKKLMEEKIVILPEGPAQIVVDPDGKEPSFELWDWGGNNQSVQDISLAWLTDKSKKELLEALAVDLKNRSWILTEQKRDRIAQALDMNIADIRNIFDAAEGTAVSKALHSLEGRTLEHNGQMYVFSIEMDPGKRFDARIVLKRVSDGYEMSSFELQTEDRFGRVEAGYIRTDEAYRRQGFAELVARNLARVFPKELTLVSKIENEETLEDLLGNKSFEHTLVGKSFKDWKAGSLVYVDENGEHHENILDGALEDAWYSQRRIKDDDWGFVEVHLKVDRAQVKGQNIEQVDAAELSYTSFKNVIERSVALMKPGSVMKIDLRKAKATFEHSDGVVSIGQDEVVWKVLGDEDKGILATADVATCTAVMIKALDKRGHKVLGLFHLVQRKSVHIDPDKSRQIILNTMAGLRQAGMKDVRVSILYDPSIAAGTHKLKEDVIRQEIQQIMPDSQLIGLYERKNEAPEDVLGADIKRDAFFYADIRMNEDAIAFKYQKPDNSKSFIEVLDWDGRLRKTDPVQKDSAEAPTMASDSDPQIISLAEAQRRSWLPGGLSPKPFLLNESLFTYFFSGREIAVVDNRYTQVKMNQYAVGKEGDMLFTQGAHPCFIVTIWDPINKVGALAHLPALPYTEFLKDVLDDMEFEIGPGHRLETSRLQVELVGGWGLAKEGKSFLQAAFMGMGVAPDNIKIEDEDVEEHALALVIKDGKTYDVALPVGLEYKKIPQKTTASVYSIYRFDIATKEVKEERAMYLSNLFPSDHAGRLNIAESRSKLNGGIDFNSDRIHLKRSGERAVFDWGMSEADLENVQINGLVPVINQITLLEDLPAFLGASR